MRSSTMSSPWPTALLVLRFAFMKSAIDCWALLANVHDTFVRDCMYDCRAASNAATWLDLPVPSFDLSVE